MKKSVQKCIPVPRDHVVSSIGLLFRESPQPALARFMSRCVHVRIVHRESNASRMDIHFNNIGGHLFCKLYDWTSGWKESPVFNARALTMQEAADRLLGDFERLLAATELDGCCVDEVVMRERTECQTDERSPLEWSAWYNDRFVHNDEYYRVFPKLCVYEPSPPSAFSNPELEISHCYNCDGPKQRISRGRPRTRRPLVVMLETHASEYCRLHLRWYLEEHDVFVRTVLGELMQRAWAPARHVDWCLALDDRRELGLAVV